MKQLFSYESDGERRIYEGDAFVTRRISEETADRLDAINKRYDELDAQSETESDEPKEPLLSPIHYVMLACGAFIIGIMIYLTSTFGSFDQGLEEKPVFAGILLVAFLIVAVLAIIDKKKRGATKIEADPTTAEFNALADEEEKLLNECFDTLGMSDDAEGFDIITPAAEYELSSLTQVETCYFTIIEDDDNLSLSDNRARYDIPKSAFVSVTHVPREISIGFTFRMFSRRFLKENGIKKTADDRYLLPSYDLFTISCDKGEFTLALPAYDGKTLAEIVGVTY